MNIPDVGNFYIKTEGNQEIWETQNTFWLRRRYLIEKNFYINFLLYLGQKVKDSSDLTDTPVCVVYSGHIFLLAVHQKEETTGIMNLNDSLGMYFIVPEFLSSKKLTKT